MGLFKTIRMDPMNDTKNYLLPESSIQKSWYNIATDGC